MKFGFGKSTGEVVKFVGPNIDGVSGNSETDDTSASAGAGVSSDYSFDI